MSGYNGGGWALWWVDGVDVLKPQCIECSSEVKDATDVGVFCSRYETGSSYKTRSNYQVFIEVIPYINGSESSSLYTRNTS